MKLKVCGITTAEQLEQLQTLNIDYAGLIFYEGSKRYAAEKLRRCQAKIRNLEIKKVGVFVNADMGFLKSLIQDFGLVAVQLHGDETPAYCDALRSAATVIRVFRIGNTTADIDAMVEPFQGVCDYFLFDTATKAYGGSGQHFDWNILKKAKIGKPFFLSGGIDADDMGVLKSFSHPFFYAVDINSRFEIAPGLKDMDAVKKFANVLKHDELWIK